DGVDLSISARLKPGNVVANGGDLPSLVSKFLRRNQHGEVRLATRTGEGSRDVCLLTIGTFHTRDQHVLGQPTFVARHNRADAQTETLLAQQRVAAVAGAVAPDQPLFGEMNDVLVFRIG